jgi:hypothetical protein
LLSSGYISSHSRLLTGISDIYIVYTAGSDYLRFRSIPFLGDTWSSEENVAAGAGIDQDFDAVVGPDGLLGVVYDDAALKYRQYDGANWGAVQTLDESPGYSPQLVFRGNVPVVIYLSPWTGDRGFVMYVERKTGAFSEPAILDVRARCFDSVLLYHNGSATYEDVSAAAGSAGPADVFHSASNCLLKDVGDALYAGLDNPFRFIEGHLSTAGSGGSIVYSYWDGVNWQAFTPVSGGAGLNATINDIVLWQDYRSIPSDWQKRLVDGHNLFWIRLEVRSAFSIGPVGDYVTAVSNVSAMSFRR